MSCVQINCQTSDFSVDPSFTCQLHSGGPRKGANRAPRQQMQQAGSSHTRQKFSVPATAIQTRSSAIALPLPSPGARARPARPGAGLGHTAPNEGEAHRKKLQCFFLFQSRQEACESWAKYSKRLPASLNSCFNNTYFYRHTSAS